MYIYVCIYIYIYIYIYMYIYMHICISFMCMLQGSGLRNDAYPYEAEPGRLLDRLQGYLAHKKQPPPIGTPQGPRHEPTVGC